MRYFVLFLIFSFSILSAQNRFRVDYNLGAVYEDGKWGDQKVVYNTFVFNINENGDAIHYTASGEKKTYRRISSIDEGKVEDYSYQAFTVIDENGIEIIIQYFNDSSIGLKLIFSPELMIQLSQIDK